MFKVSSKMYSVLSIICAVLALCLLVVQFLPYWQEGEGEEAKGVSVQALLWFPEHHKDLQKAFDAQYDVLKEESADIIEEKAAAAVAAMNLPEEQVAKEQKNMVKEITQNEYTYNINKATLLPVVMFFLLVGSIVLCAVFNKNILPSVLPVGAGVVGAINYLNNLIFTVSPMKNVHLGISAALAVAGIVTLVAGIVELVKKQQKEKNFA